MSMTSIAVPLILTSIAGISTVIGALFSISLQKIGKKSLSFSLGLSAGVMIFLSFVELLPSAMKEIGYTPSIIALFAGILIMGILDFFLPHHYLKERICSSLVYDTKVFSTGVMTTFGIFIHNIPEGIAVFMSSFTDIKLGVLLAVAITIHNIPEGIAIASPIYYATKNKRRALKYALFSGLAEPIGGILTFFLFQSFLSSIMLSYILAFVAGVMIFISFDELLPSCFQNSEGHAAIIGIICGMAIIAMSLLVL